MTNLDVADKIAVVYRERTAVELRYAILTALDAKDAELTSLRSQVEALRGAMTPSAETKAAYIGEFRFDEPSDSHFGGPVSRTVPWTTIKEIMAAIRGFAASASTWRPANGGE